MKSQAHGRLSPSTVVLSVALAAVSFWTAAAAEPALEGTWKISAAQSSFKPEHGAVPFTAEGRKRYEANKRQQAKRNYEAYDYATARCASPGLPRLMLTPDRFRIWQRPGQVAFQFEWNRNYRQIALPGLVEPQLRGKPGLSIAGTGDEEEGGRSIPVSAGHWESDTLVVATQGFIDTTLVDDLVPHGVDMKLTERIRLKDADTLEDRITIEDPEYFTRPWETVVTYKRQPDGPFREDVCLERLAAGQPTLAK